MSKVIALILPVLFSATVLAGYNCSTMNGDLVSIASVFPRGIGVKVQSNDASEFYKKYLGAEISGFESTIDPETKKYLTEENNDGFLFGLQAIGAKIDNIWSLSFEFKPDMKAQGILMDMEGNGFKFDLICEKTIELE